VFLKGFVHLDRDMIPNIGRWSETSAISIPAFENAELLLVIMGSMVEQLRLSDPS